MKAITRILTLALASCLMLAACEKEDGASNNTVTVNGVTYENVEATVDDSQRGLWFQFVLTSDRKTTASALIDDGIALQKTLKYGVDEGNGGYGDWMCLYVEYPDGKGYSVEPASGTQTIKKKDGGYSVLIDGKDDNGKEFKMDLFAKTVQYK
jgi:hypothetical protein